MASSRRTYDTDVITLRTVFAKNPGNSNIPGMRVLTADGQGGTYWAIPSSLGMNPSFNEIITSAGTYTADLSYNVFRLLAGENMGMVGGPAGSNQTTLFAKAFSEIDISGENRLYAFRANQLDSSLSLAGQNGITLRGDPATNTLFIVGPASNAYTLSTGIYGFNQIKVTEAASTITSSILGWDGTYITATSPSTVLRFAGYNDIQLSTNVTTNSIFFTISTFTSKGYLDISAAAYGAYPSSISTVSSLYTPLNVFNSTIAYLSSYTGFSFSSVVSSIDALAMSTGDQFYILTGLINARATIVQLNSEISNVNTNMQSTTVGLGTLGYISTGSGGVVGQSQLVSTVDGLGSAGYISSAAAGDVVKANLFSTVQGLGSAGYISSLSTIITSSIFNTGAISTYSLEVFGPATLTNSGSTILRGPVYVQGPLFIASTVGGTPGSIVASSNLTSTVAGLGATYVSTPSLISTTRGLGSAGYISSTQLRSTVDTLATQGYVSSSQLTSSLRGIGSMGYLSALRGFSVSSGNIFVSSLNLLDVYTSAVNFITISSGSLLVNGAKIEGGGGGGGGGGVAQLLAGTNISLSPASGTGIVTVTNIGPTQTDINSAVSSFSTALGGNFYNFSTVSSSYASTFTTALLNASTMTTANILPSQSNVWVAVGYGATTPNSIQFSGDGRNWSNSTGGGFSLAGKGVAYNGSLWVAVGNNGGTSGSIQVSTDGRSWSPQASGGFSSGGNGVAYNGSVWIAVGNNGGAALTSIQTSSNGRSWSGVTAGGFSVAGESIAFNGSYWVAVGLSASVQDTIQYSVDGQTWVSATTGGFSAGGKGIAWNGSLWVAVGDDSTRAASIQYSGDGRNWSNAASGGFISAGAKIAWNGRIWVAVGDDNVAAKSIQTSVDGSNWSDVATGGFSGDGYAVAWNGFYWVAGGIAGSAVASLQTSVDGSSWTNASSGGFASGCIGLAFSSNLAPGYSQQNLTILSQNIPLYLRSTNQFFAQPSSLLIDNTLLVDGQWKRVGVNCNSPQTDLDVGGIGRFLTVSTQALNVSSLNGVSYNQILPSTVVGLGSAQYVSTASLASTTQGVQVALNSTIGAVVYDYKSASGYLSTVSLASTTAGVQVALNSTIGAVVYDYKSASGYLSTVSLASTTQGVQEAINSTIGAVVYDYKSASGYLSTVSLASTTAGIQFTLNSTVAGLGQSYLSSLLDVSLISTLALNVSSINGALPGSGSGNGSSITVSTGSLYASSMSFVNVAPASSNLWVALGNDTNSNRRIQISQNGISWSNSTSGAFSVRGESAAWNGKMWVAVGQDATVVNTIKYSYDGLTWSNSLGTGFTTIGNDVAWNGRMWVAVGQDATANNTIQYSYNGFTWSNSDNGFSSAGQGVAWNGYMWVAIGQDATLANRIKYSYNGINWSNSASNNFGGGGQNVAWNGYTWVAVGNPATSSIQVSRDGINWSNALSGTFTSAGNAIGWNGRMWVAGGTDSTFNARLKYSFDGLNWSDSFGGGAFFTGSVWQVKWTDNRWVATGNDSTAINTLKYSFDGIRWSNSTGFAFSTEGRGVAYSSNVVPSYNQTNFEIEPQNIPMYLTSTNQLSFLPSTIIANNTLFVDARNRVGINTGNPQTDLDVAGTGRFQILSTLALNISSINGTVYSAGGSGNGSSIGVSTGSLYASSMSFVNVAQTSSNLWLAVGEDSTNPIKYSLNGINWSNSSGGFTTAGRGIAYNGRLWVAVGDDSTQDNRIKYSINGINWSNSQGTGFTGLGYGVAWNGRLWVAVGSDSTQNNTIKYSGNGINWSNSQGTGFTGQGNYVAWNGRMWVAVGSDSTQNNRIKYSLDGINWSNSSGSGFTSVGYGVAWNGRLWVAVGTDSTANNTIKYSGDGINWSNSSGSGFTTLGNDVAWNGRMWVAVGLDGTASNTIKYSFDGINWSNSSGIGFTVGGYGVAWNGIQWVATGQDSTQDNRLKYSSDGINWSNSAGTGFATLRGYKVAYSSNVVPSYNQTNFEIESQNIPNYLTSTNQLSFLPSTIIANNTLFVDTTNRVGINTGRPETDLDVAGIGRFQTVSTLALNISSINGTIYSAGGGGGGSSGNGSSITVSTAFVLTSSISQARVPSYTSNIWVAAANEFYNPIYYSFNGITWSNNPTGTFLDTTYGIAYNGRMWIATGTKSGGGIAYSYNGISWSVVSGTFGSGVYSPVWTGRMWVAGVAFGTTSFIYSGDGFNWTYSASGSFTGACYGLAWSGRMLVGVGEDSGSNRIKYSYNGSNWFNAGGSRFDGVGGSGYGVAWGGNLWVATGYDPTAAKRIIYSGDGLTWSNATSGIPASFEQGNCVAHNGKRWVLGGYTNSLDPSQILLYSDNGTAWSPRASGGFNCNVGGVAWNGHIWVITGLNSVVTNGAQFSTDGANWTQGSGNMPLEAKNVAFSSNVFPSYSQDSLDIYSYQVGNALYLRSTNQITCFTSSLMINNTLLVDLVSQRVGIGCNNPAYTLDVNGTINAFTAVKSNGTNLTSDRRIKQFITTADLDICYSNVKNLPLRRFEFIEPFKVTKFDGKQIGFVADEVEMFYPKAVNLFSTNVGGFSTIKHLNYDQIFFANFGATKRLMNVVESQDSTIKGQAMALETLNGQFSFVLSTLEGLQGR